MSVEVCRVFFISCIVLPAEADMQAGRNDNTAIPVCRDSDLLGYGNKEVVIVDSYFKEEARVFDMTVPVTDEIKEKYPLYVYYHKHGVQVLHWWAAVMGCDISEHESGIHDAGEKAFLSALASFDSAEAQLLTTKSFAEALREHSGGIRSWGRSGCKSGQSHGNVAPCLARGCCIILGSS